eukprot:GEZU01020139.1.p1 GENE.GEZU01020139.1~~GEZU01020139.1.p1  ORF type:complete len:701 (-),score=127.54 GEZU01020139.1:368-2470(-)
MDITAQGLTKDSKCLKTGWLRKRGGSIQTWHTRYFVLVGSNLYYFKNDKAKEPLGVIHVTPDTVERAKDTKKPHCLQIKTKERTFLAQAETEQEVEQWIYILKDSLRAGVSEHVTQARLKGYLDKKAKFCQEWKTRYFTYANGVLHYFRLETDTKPKGYIDLSMCKVSRAALGQEGCNRRCAMKITTEKRIYFISSIVENSIDEGEINIWVDTLRSATKEGNTAPSAGTVYDPPLSARTPRPSAYSSSRSNSVVATPRGVAATPRGVDAAPSGPSAKDITMSGWLTKQGGSHKTWKRRWFVLKNCVLSYFKDPADPAPIDSINLIGRIVTRADDEIGIPHALQLLTPSRTYYMYAETGDDAEKWMNTLKLACKVLPQDVMQNINSSEKNGWLTKRGGSVKTWKKRFCILRGSVLFYYKDRNDTEPKGYVDIAGHCVRRMRPAEATLEVDKKNCLKIVCPERTWYMYAEKSEEIDDWAASMRQAALLLSGNTHIVDVKGGRGKFRSIKDAIEAAKPLDRIVVQEGIYRESLVVNKALIIEGIGEVTVESEARPVVTFITTTARMSNMVFRQKVKQDVNCIEIQSGNVVLDYCDIVSEGGDGIRIGKYSQLQIMNSNVSHCKQYGVYFTDSSDGILENNIISENEWDGLMCMGDSSFVARANKIYLNQYNGVSISSDRICVLEHNEIYENEWQAHCLLDTMP